MPSRAPATTLLEVSEEFNTISEGLHDLLAVMSGLSSADRAALRDCCGGLDVSALAREFDSHADEVRFLARTPSWMGGRASNPRHRRGY